MAPQQTTHCVNLRNNFDFRDYRIASSPGRALLVSLTWSELGWGFFSFWGLVKQIVIRRALLLVLVVAVIAAFLPANYRKICLPRLVIVVAAVFVVVVVVVFVVRALLDNCVTTTSSSSLSTSDATRRLLYTPFWARCRLHSFSACLRLAMRFWTGATTICLHAICYRYIYNMHVQFCHIAWHPTRNWITRLRLI